MGKNTPKIRLFLITLLNLVAQGEQVSITYIEKNIQNGIASALFEKYEKNFDKNGIDVDYVRDVDEYYKQWAGCIDQSDREYNLSDNDGLLLLVALILNDII